MTAVDEESRLRPPNGGSRPVPDPTELTDKAIAKAVASLTDYIDGQLQVRDERLRGIDEATRLRLTGVENMPDLVRDSVDNLERLQNEKFSSIQTQFRERDIRAERESRDNKVAVDAAFAAQKESAAQRDLANAEAIGKSERSTAETIKTNQELNRSTTDALAKSLDEVKISVTRIDSVKVGAIENRGQSGENRSALYATVSIIITVVLAAITIVGVLIAAAQ